MTACWLYVFLAGCNRDSDPLPEGNWENISALINVERVYDVSDYIDQQLLIAADGKAWILNGNEVTAIPMPDEVNDYYVKRIYYQISTETIWLSLDVPPTGGGAFRRIMKIDNSGQHELFRNYYYATPISSNGQEIYFITRLSSGDAFVIRYTESDTFEEVIRIFNTGPIIGGSNGLTTDFGLVGGDSFWVTIGKEPIFFNSSELISTSPESWPEDLLVTDLFIKDDDVFFATNGGVYRYVDSSFELVSDGAGAFTVHVDTDDNIWIQQYDNAGFVRYKNGKKYLQRNDDGVIILSNVSRIWEFSDHGLLVLNNGELWQLSK